MLSAFDQQRVLRAGDVAETLVIAHPAAFGMTFIADHRGRRAEPQRQVDTFVQRTRDNQRLAAFVHRMEVEQGIYRIDDRTHLASPCELAGRTRCVVEYLAGPHTVEVLIDETGGIGLRWIKARIRVDIRERE